MGVFGSRQEFSSKTDEQLWYEISENLSELSRRQAVDVKITANADSVKDKLKGFFNVDV
tara:strand:+ start:270 stop:446 length:177 start_codon:yes stop_codon:yes gene_type:complete